VNNINTDTSDLDAKNFQSLLVTKGTNDLLLNDAEAQDEDNTGKMFGSVKRNIF
jgi:hypothetical protein